jgi:hypothetical protein
MANLKVRFPRAMEVVNADVDIEVRGTDGELMGRLQISKGTVDWVPANKQLRRRMSWRKFAQLMEEHGRPVR